ncbi:MAG: hypothetical protein ABI596_13970 [Pyrinomonadaceae bacterium]
MIIKRMALATAVVFLVTVAVRAQDSCQRQVELVGGFSICIPEGWRVQEKEGQKFKLLFGTSGPTFTPNINFKDAIDPRPISDYATAGVDYILKNFQEVGATSVKLISKTPITTAAGAQGMKVAMRAEFKGLLILSQQYYFNGKGDQKLILTATSLEADQATLDPIFDRAAKSFRLEK